MAPQAWRDGAPALVACVEPERESIVERCPSGDSTAMVLRTRYPREVRIVAARTAREVGRTTADSLEDPDPCDPQDRRAERPLVQRRSAPRVQPADVVRALDAWGRAR